VFHGASVAAKHDDIVTAVDKAIGRGGETVDAGEQPAEHTFANSLCADVGIVVGQRIALRLVPLDVGGHGAEKHRWIVVREGGVGRLNSLHAHGRLRCGMEYLLVEGSFRAGS